MNESLTVLSHAEIASGFMNCELALSITVGSKSLSLSNIVSVKVVHCYHVSGWFL